MISPTVSGKRIKFMATCLCDGFYGDVAKASYEVLEHLGCEIEFPGGQTCCGQPAHNAGDWDNARKVVGHTIRVFEGEDPVVTPSGSCAAMLRHGAMLCLEEQPEAPEARALADRTWELAEYIVHGLGVTSWPGRFAKKVALHRSCHTRGTKVYDSAITLLSSIDGLELTEVGELDQCCGFGGTFCVSFPEISKNMGQLKIDHLIAGKPDCIATLDMACAMHFGGMMDRQKIEVPRMHVAQILLAALQEERKTA